MDISAIRMVTFALVSVLLFPTPSFTVVLEGIAKNKTLSSKLLGKRVGYYVGSFDPLHLGHEEMINGTLKQKLCDYVLIYTHWGGDTYKKRSTLVSRQKMLFLRYRDHPRVIVTALPPLEMQKLLTQPKDKDGNTHKVVPSIPGLKFIGMLGSDIALRFQVDLVELLKVYMRGVAIKEDGSDLTLAGFSALPVDGFIVGVRNGDSVEILKGNIGDRPILSTFSTSEHDAVSSSMIKDEIRKKKPIEHLIHPKLSEFVLQERLYGS